MQIAKKKKRQKEHKRSLKCIIVKKNNKIKKDNESGHKEKKKKRSAMVSVDKNEMTRPPYGRDEEEQPRCVHFPFWLCSRSQCTACLV